jgi:hypothetical protein
MNEMLIVTLYTVLDDLLHAMEHRASLRQRRLAITVEENREA